MHVFDYEMRGAQRAADLDRVVEIERACFPEKLAYTRDELRRFLRAPNAQCMVAVDRTTGFMGGFVIVSWRKGAKVGYIQTIDVAPDAQGNGLGHLLLETAERIMAERGLTRSILQVYLRNNTALILYLKTGYTIRRARTRYYRNSFNGARDALELVKEIAPMAPTRLVAPEVTLIASPGLGTPLPPAPAQATPAAPSV
jgi:ribosomal protein S18 acetylase RimI-like enzyme